MFYPGSTARRTQFWFITLTLAWAVTGFVVAGQTLDPDAYVWYLPEGFQPPVVPADNPMTNSKVALGRRLFFDKRLSGNLTMSCATCHDPIRGFTDGKAHPVGITGEEHPRNTMSLANVAYSPGLTWSNPTLTRLEDQALTPMFGEHPVEMGLARMEKTLVERLQADPDYPAMFAKSFPKDKAPVTVHNVTYALAAFERTLVSGLSPFDRYRTVDDPRGMSESAKRGVALFFSERLACIHCHAGSNLGRYVNYQFKPAPEPEFFNTGLYNIGGTGRYPSPNEGLISSTNKPEDMGRFKPPTLRNIAVTGPYMHDGSIATLEDVLDHYAAGGRTIESGPYAGVGAKNPYKSKFMVGFQLTPQEKSDLIAFLISLTDPVFLTNKQFRDPNER